MTYLVTDLYQNKELNNKDKYRVSLWINVSKDDQMAKSTWKDIQHH